MDVGLAAADILEVGRRLVAAHPDVKAVVLECPILPPYAHALRGRWECRCSMFIR